MNRYAKIVDVAQLSYAPRTVTEGNTHHNPTPEWWLIQHGYLPVVTTEMPEYDPETQFLTSRWAEQDGQIMSVWQVNALSEEMRGGGDDE